MKVLNFCLAVKSRRSEGYFVEPTIFADVRDEMTIAKEEIFGPVISALPYDDIDECDCTRK